MPGLIDRVAVTGALLLSCWLSSSAQVHAQAAPSDYRILEPESGDTLVYSPSTGIVQSLPDEEAPPQRGPATTIRLFAAPRAERVQLWFQDFNLGTSSSITVRSPVTGQEQRMDDKDLRSAGGYSAVFDGEQLEVVLNVGEGEVGIYYADPKIIASTHPKEEAVAPEGDEQSSHAGEEQLCGQDDRAASDERRIGRTLYSGCTAFLIGDGLLLSAGHCNFPEFESVEFNVPESSPEGQAQTADPRDQYRVVFPPLGRANDETATIGDPFPAHGDDWVLFNVAPNAVTGLLPGQAQGGFFPRSRELEPGEVTVTGYGLDDAPPQANRAQQTASGSYKGLISVASSDVVVQHMTDTRGGNSGSPILARDAQGALVAIGIHTGGECDPALDNPNRGTSFRNEGLWQAIEGAAPPMAARQQ